MFKTKIDKMIIGLGNPGEKYSDTRHNIGYMIVDKLVQKYKKKYKNKFCIANYSMISIAGQNILFVLPITYMNCSGEAAYYFLKKYKIASSNMLVILDEYNFSIGKIHIKKVSSDGGHNGLASIIANTETLDFHILRCGIDKKFNAGELVDYVLSPFNEDEKNEVDFMINNAVKAIEFYIENEIGKCLSYINSKKYLEECTK